MLKPKLVKSQFDRDGKASIHLEFAQRKFQICYINALQKEWGAYSIGEAILNKDSYLHVKSEHIILKRTILEKLDLTQTHYIVIRLV